MDLLNDRHNKIANREAWIGVILVIFHFTWWFSFAYGLGKKDPSEYQYVFGFPAWFFYSCIAGIIVMIFLVTVAVLFFFKDIPFDEESGES